MGMILRRYIFREILVPFVFGLALFTLTLLTARILKLIELIVNRGLSLEQTVQLFAYILPTFLEFTVPMALLQALLIAFGRMTTDSEFTALKTSGLSLYQIMIPAGAFIFCNFLLTLCLSLWVRPWGNHAMDVALYRIAKTHATAGLREKVFNNGFAGLVIYAEEIQPPGSLFRGILIADERDPAQHTTILAQEGSLISDEQRHTITLRLLHGTIHSFFPQEKGYHKTDFNMYDMNLNLGPIAAPHKDPEEMTLMELRQRIMEKTAAGKGCERELVELHHRVAIPFACLVFGLVGVSLGVQPVRVVRASGFVISLVLIFVYYLFLSLGETVGRKGLLPPAFAMWVPNGIFAFLGVYLFTASAREIALLPPHSLRRAVKNHMLAVASRFAFFRET